MRKLFKCSAVLVLVLYLLPVSVVAQEAATEHKHTEEYHKKIRDEWNNKLLDLVGVEPGMRIGEVGAGSGELTIVMAERVGETGHVFANEINQKLVGEIKENCKKADVDNVTTILGEEADPLFTKGDLDMVIMVRVYHHLTQPSPMLKAILTSIKPGGRLVIVEPDSSLYEENDRSHTSDPDKVRSFAEKSGFEFVRQETMNKQFVLILRAVASNGN